MVGQLGRAPARLVHTRNRNRSCTEYFYWNVGTWHRGSRYALNEKDFCHMEVTRMTSPVSMPGTVAYSLRNKCKKRYQKWKQTTYTSCLHAHRLWLSPCQVCKRVSCTRPWTKIIIVDRRAGVPTSSVTLFSSVYLFLTQSAEKGIPAHVHCKHIWRYL